MILRSALVAGVLALKASAFLVPLEVAKEVEAAKAQLGSLWSSKAQTVELACRGCAFPGPQQEGIAYSENDENTIEIEVLVKDSSSVQINGQTVISPNGLLPPPALTASQIRVSDSAASRPRHLGYVVAVRPALSFEHEKAEIISLQFNVLDLEGIPAKVDTLQVDLLKNSGGLAIVRIFSIPFDQSPGAKECTTSLCQLHAITIARVRAILEAARARAHAVGNWMKTGCHGKKHGGNQAGPATGDHPHYPHHGHHKMHRFRRILRQTLRFFIIPALLGVIGGLLASAVGMLVGQALVYLWLRFHRGGQRGNIRIVEVATSEDEKEALVDAEDLPPQYDDVEAVMVEDAKQ